MWIHRIVGFSIFSLTMIFVLNMISYFDWEISSAMPHYLIGTFILCCVGVVMAGGIFARSRLNRA